jgi:hypothetical protein
MIDSLEQASDLSSRNQIFYRGVVEDNQDPLKMGRVRVRIFGIHSEDPKVNPVDNLPWAECLVSPDFGLISGIGVSSVPEQGCYVWVFFDAGEHDHPVVIGVTAGVRKQRDTISFCDKDLKYPLLSRLNEPDYNRLARGEKQDQTPCAKKQQDNKVEEPYDNYKKGKYTKNKVLETSSGHVIEIDDTEGNERIHIFHKSGSLIEMLPDGKIVIKSLNNTYEIVNGDRKTHITGNSIEFIDSDIKRETHGSETIKIGGNVSFEIGGSLSFKTGGATNFHSGGAFSVSAPSINLN